MKRFVLNKIKIAKLAELKGKGPVPDENSVYVQECLSSICNSSSGIMPCTNTSIEGCEVTDPVGTSDTLPV